MRRILALLLACLAVPAWTEPPRTGPARPNFVMVLIDDLGWGDFGCFGNAAARTPHVDRLAAEGVRFTQFYVNAPICSPSRTALLTGQYPQRWRIGSFLASREENRKRGIADWLDPAAPSVARSLRDAGYSTGHFGKWHLGGQRDVGDAPDIAALGFDASLTNFEGLGPRVLPLLDARDGKPPRRHALGSDTLGRGEITWRDRTEVTTAFADAAIAFMRRSAAAGKPFLVNLWPDDVHTPLLPPEGKRGDGSKRDLYLGVLENLDARLAPVFDFLRADPALRDNTLVLLCSDNGPEPGAGSAGPFRGAKASLHEGGVRSPLIAWGPGLIPAARAGARDESTVLVAMDLAPTLLALAGVAPPAGVAFDGQDMSAAFRGTETPPRRAPIFWRRPAGGEQWNRGVNLPDLAVRDGDWKFLCEYDGSQPELYDLAQDPGEKNNLAATSAEVANRLRDALLAWHAALPPDADSAAAAKPVVTARTERVVYKRAGDRELFLHVDKPAGWAATDRRPAAVFFFGGGWVGGTPEQFKPQSTRLAERGLVGVRVEYRVIPKGDKGPPVLPCADAKSAMRWVRAHAAELGIDPNRIAAAGGSAGGHLAAFTTLVPGLDDPADDLKVSPKGNALILFNPVLDNGPGEWGHGRVGERFREFSPAHHAAPGAPPCLLLLGDRDDLIPVATLRRFETALRAAGARAELEVYAGAGHGFFNKDTPEGDWFTRTTARMETFLQSLGWLE